MIDTADLLRVGRNLAIYAVAVGVLVVAALGMAGAIDLSLVLAVPLFLVGLALIFFVHESLGGPF